MILIFGGTTEGRIAAKVVDEAGKLFYYSTKSDWQEIAMNNGKRVVGAMQATDMTNFCVQNGIRCIIDAAHPFAQNLHATIAEVANALFIPIIRLQRNFGEKQEGVTYCKDYEEAISEMNKSNVKCLLALSGANTICKLKDFWQQHDTWFRILPKEESEILAANNGFPQSRLIFYDKTPTVEEEENTMKYIGCDAIITKESGDTGGFQTKIDAAKHLDIKIFVISHPSLPENFIIATGEHSLRHEIERIIPDFYPLRTGYTTGLCATAAAKAALLALITKDTNIHLVNVTIPNGEDMPVDIENTNLTESYCECSVVKNAGDDPDVTNGCIVKAKVEYADTNKLCNVCNDNYSQEKNNIIKFIGGEGVGTVTLPGLGLEIGEPAINPTPRKMIYSELRKLTIRSLNVTISVPGGEELAKRTFNPKVGVIGGISIIGTSGIVRPFSNEAFIESIQREMNVAKAMNCKTLVINSGGKSENMIRPLYPELPPQAFIHYGNFIGETLKAAKEMNFEKVSMGLMIGKAVKLAEGNLDTHSHKVTMNKDFLKSLAKDCGCEIETIRTIENIQLARELWDKLEKSQQNVFFKALLKRCLASCSTVFPKEKLTIFLVSEKGNIVSL